MELVDACDRYAKDGLEAKKAEMKERAWEEVQVFKEQCKVHGETETGEQILTSLLANRDGSNGQKVGRLCTAASPEKVAMWIRAENCHPVIWHMVKREYQFASDLHAQAAHEIVNSPPRRSA